MRMQLNNCETRPGKWSTISPRMRVKCETHSWVSRQLFNFWGRP